MKIKRFLITTTLSSLLITVFCGNTLAQIETTENALTVSVDVETTTQADLDKGFQLPPFVAQFDVSLNGKYIGYAEMALVQMEDQSFEVRLSSKATKGAAGFARARSRELARFIVDDGETRSLHYEREEKLLFSKDNWHADFDWNQRTLNVDNEGDLWSEPLQGTELDSLSVYLLLADAASKSRPWLTTKVVDNESIETFSYQMLANEQLDSACGSVDTRVYQGILPDSHKKVWTWHAERAQWLPIRVRKTRKRGNILQLDLRAIESTVSPSLNCGVIDRS